MNNMRVSLVAVICFIALLTGSSCRDIRIHEHSDWGKYFEDNGIKNACFILRDNNHEAIHYYNKERSLKRFTPASTFKIFNSLVALETSLAPDEQFIIRWDSVKTSREACNKDLTMREAFRESCVNYYREIARRIGKAQMQHYLDTVKYGNMQMGNAVDSFWLNNTMQISADEQVGFVKRLYFNELPFAERTQRIVRSMMLWEDQPGYKLYYKTGQGEVDGKYIYWIVGFSERIEKVKEPKESMNKSNERMYPYFFAENFELPVSDTSKDWAKVRLDILHQLLKEVNAIPR
jgi:beta-lactamase class D